MTSSDGSNLPESLDVLVGFLGDEELTTRIARLEHELDGARVSDIPLLLTAANVDRRLLQSALVVRARLGRMNDLIHATAIALALPLLLDPDEQLVRPSLAAGNDPSRPFDVETDRRIAEFKLSRWAGADAMRKRQVFKDLVHLAADASGRRAELYVLGDRPIRFLRTSTSKASWGLDRSPRERAVFEERFGLLERRICDFTAAEGAHVALIDLEERLPAVFVGYDDPSEDEAPTASES
ncbi:MAG: PE-PGRS family protein [Acidimicrobiales bacterium]